MNFVYEIPVCLCACCFLFPLILANGYIHHFSVISVISIIYMFLLDFIHFHPTPLLLNLLQVPRFLRTPWDPHLAPLRRHHACRRGGGELKAGLGSTGSLQRKDERRAKHRN